MYNYYLGWNNRLLDQVPYQTLLYMREVEHMSNAEIAERVDCSTATIRKILGKQGFRKARVVA